jgi:hypothetical protein
MIPSYFTDEMSVLIVFIRCRVLYIFMFYYKVKICGVWIILAFSAIVSIINIRINMFQTLYFILYLQPISSIFKCPFVSRI